MAFWGGQKGAIVDPKRQFRWLISFGNNVTADGTIGLQSWYAKSATKPQFQVGETPHQFLNHTFFYPGRVTWQEVEVTLVDPARENDASMALMSILKGSGYYLPTDPSSASRTITKAEAVQALGGQVFLDQLGKDDFPSNRLERWTLINPWIKSVNFGSLDYSSEDMVEISLTLQYDYATLEAGGRKLPTPKGL